MLNLNNIRPNLLQFREPSMPFHHSKMGELLAAVQQGILERFQECVLQETAAFLVQNLPDHSIA
jgi:hypothetical protein